MADGQKGTRVGLDDRGQQERRRGKRGVQEGREGNKRGGGSGNPVRLKLEVDSNGRLVKLPSSPRAVRAPSSS
jgi:hypothetical protein